MGRNIKIVQLFHQIGDNFNKLFGNWPDFEPNAKYLAKYQTFGKSQIIGNFHQRYLAKPLAGCYGQRFGRSNICFNTVGEDSGRRDSEGRRLHLCCSAYYLRRSHAGQWIMFVMLQQQSHFFTDKCSIKFCHIGN